MTTHLDDGNLTLETLHEAIKRIAEEKNVRIEPINGQYIVRIDASPKDE